MLSTIASTIDSLHTVNHSAIHPLSQPLNQLLSQPYGQPLTQSTTRSTTQSTTQASTQRRIQSTPQSTIQSTSQSTVRSTSQSTIESTIEATAESTDKTIRRVQLNQPTLVREFLFARSRNRLTVIGSFNCCQNGFCGILFGELLKIDEGCRRIVSRSVDVPAVLSRASLFCIVARMNVASRSRDFSRSAMIV